ncbi:MAG: dihydroneopterin aldolase [Hyphomicrobiales bacterium]|nr:dihydroneopterin aldolase [Hyphomicrobiales bacterium]
MNEQATQRTPPRADALRGLAHVFVRDLVVKAVIGVHDHEKLAPQPLRVSIDLTVHEAPDGHGDKIGAVVCYEDIVRGVQTICAEGHVNLIETLAEKIATFCLTDKRVHGVRIKVEKPEAFSECAVGIEIERLQTLDQV